MTDEKIRIKTETGQTLKALQIASVAGGASS